MVSEEYYEFRKDLDRQREVLARFLRDKFKEWHVDICGWWPPGPCCGGKTMKVACQNCWVAVFREIDPKSRSSAYLEANFARFAEDPWQLAKLYLSDISPLCRSTLQSTDTCALLRILRLCPLFRNGPSQMPDEVRRAVEKVVEWRNRGEHDAEYVMSKGEKEYASALLGKITKWVKENESQVAYHNEAVRNPAGKKQGQGTVSFDNKYINKMADPPFF